MPPASTQDSRALADAFSEFISASAVLEDSYRSLQQEVARLSSELTERNAALRTTLADNERMRATLQQLMDSLPCGVLVLNGLDEVLMINPAGRKLLNLDAETIRNLADLSRLTNPDLNKYAQITEVCFETETCVTTAGGTHWLAITKQILDPKLGHGSSGQSLTDPRSIWTFRDVTAAKFAEDARESARNATALAEVSTILAHEIRNPLASMELFAGLIVDQPEESEEWIANLRAGIRLLAATVNNVLTVHSGAGPSFRPINLSDSLRNAINFVRPIADQAGVRITLKQSSEPISIHGNTDLIQQIILNLVSNAIRHTQAPGCITVCSRCILKARRRYASVRITDSGCGIPPEILEQIFDPGVSGDGSTPGLGLTVCKRLMTQLGGEIAVTSRMGEGTTFELEFPAQ